MTAINLNEIDPDCVYDADDVAALFGIHRTTVHKQIFPRITTQRIGRRQTTTGEQVIRYARGEVSQPPAAA